MRQRLKTNLQSKVDEEIIITQGGRVEKFLSRLDIFGKKIEFTFDATTSTVTNQFGGFMTIFFGLVASYYVTTQMIMMYLMQKSEFKVSDYTY